MGKILLVAIVVGACYSVWSIWSQWSERVNPAPNPPAVLPVQENPVMAKPTSQPTPAPTVEPQPQTLVLRVIAIIGDCLWVESWGKVERGDLLPDGSTLLSWYRVGNDRFAKVRSGARDLVVRFERRAEAAARAAVAAVQTQSTNAAVATSILAPFEASKN